MTRALRSAANLAATIGALAAVLASGACSGASDTARAKEPSGAAAPAKVRLQLNWVPEPEFGGMYAAEQDGLFAREGLAVELIAGSAGTPVPQMVASGTVEFGVMSGDQLLALRERGGGAVAAFTVFHTSPMGVMVKESSPHRSLESLWKSDATVAMEAGLPFVRYLNGRFPGGKVRIVPTGSGLAAFEHGSVDAQQCFISAEPVQMELRMVPVRVYSLAEGGYDPYTVTVAVNPEFLRRDRAACERLVRALREGWKRYLADPARYNAAISRLNPSMTVEAMDVAAAKQRDLVAPREGDEVGWMTRERWSTLAAQLVELGTLKEAPKVIDDAFWNAPR